LRFTCGGEVTEFLLVSYSTRALQTGVRRKRQRLPSSLVIENADSANAIGFGFEAFPMNATDKP
jgi:hypothetical protein